MNRRRVLLLIAAAVAPVALALSCVVFVWAACFEKRPSVSVTVTNFRPNSHFSCIIADADSGLEAMHWFARLITPIEMPPNSTAGYRNPNWPLHQPETRWVSWKHGTRYGVVQRSTDGKWTVTWFDARDVHGIEARSVVFDLAKGRTEPLPEDAIPLLELDEVRGPT